jgi:hypothetical protein
LLNDSRLAFGHRPVQDRFVAGASVGKASRRFSSLKSGFCFHRVRLDGMKGALIAVVTPGAGSVGAWKQRLGLDFQGDNAKSTASGHDPPEPGLTDFDGVRTGWAEF